MHFVKTQSIAVLFALFLGGFFNGSRLNALGGRTVNVGTPQALQNALTTVLAGDDIVVAPGSYPGRFIINSISGTAAAPITVRSSTAYSAILVGSGSDADANNVGFDIASKAFWIIEGFEFRNHREAIKAIGCSGIEVRRNIIHSFTRDGVLFQGSSSGSIHHNVIAFSHQPNDFNNGGVRLTSGANLNSVEENIIYSITNDGYQAGSKHGYAIIGIHGGGHVNGNVIRGNLVMDCGKALIRILSDWPAARECRDNIIRDNIAAFSEGGSYEVNSVNSNFNVVANNFARSCLYAMSETKGNVPGMNQMLHNTFIVDAFTRIGSWVYYATTFDTGSTTNETNLTVKNNLFYGTDLNDTYFQFLLYRQGQATFLEENHNLFWRPGPDAGNSRWVSGVTYGPQDIHDPAKQPIFSNPSVGDYSLAGGSPGKNAASDGTDMGANLTGLQKQFLSRISALPTSEQATNGSVSVSFQVSPAHQYQVYAFIPQSNPYMGNEVFNISGVQISRNIATLVNSGWVQGTKQRWAYLGTHPNNGTLAISFQHANASSKFFIRQMPTPFEAASWIPGGGSGSIPAPTGVNVSQSWLPQQQPATPTALVVTPTQPTTQQAGAAISPILLIGGVFLAAMLLDD